jgi:hypothetical protein
MENYFYMTPAEKEVAIAVVKAKLKASTVLPTPTKEPFDYPIAMVPFAHAALEILAESAIGSGAEDDFWSFLDDALTEAVIKAKKRS